MVNLGLVVVDEQHRFGVAQRQPLAPDVGSDAQLPRHDRDADPALAVEHAVRRRRPQRAARDAARARSPSRPASSPCERIAAYEFVRTEVHKGRQAFVICPLIEESDKLGARSATAEYERLSTSVFPDLRVELLHGRMPAREKAERMDRFVAR